MSNEIINTTQYPEYSAGSIMTTEYVCLFSNMTVAEAFVRIQEVGRDKENIYTCYVTDNVGKLIGMVSARMLLLTDQESLVGDIMEPHVISAHILDDQETLMNNLRKYGFMALPVVDDDERLVGIFTFDDAFVIQEEEATEDFEKMAAISPSEEPYLDTGVFTLAKHRLPWLLILMIFATFTGELVATFEDSLAALPALIAFVPMLMNTGGNAGTQSSTLIIRGMALGEIAVSNTLEVLWKELLVSLVCGAFLFVTTYASVLFLGEGHSMAITVCLAVLATLVMSNIIGSSLTFGAKAMNIDPAIMAAPLLTSVIDAAALAVYFVLARAILRI